MKVLCNNVANTGGAWTFKKLDCEAKQSGIYFREKERDMHFVEPAVTQ